MPQPWHLEKATARFGAQTTDSYPEFVLVYVEMRHVILIHAFACIRKGQNKLTYDLVIEHVNYSRRTVYWFNSLPA